MTRGSALALAALVCVLLVPAGSVQGQNVVDSFTPHVNAWDLREIEVDSQGNLWIASNGGLLRFAPGTGEWEAHPRLLGSGPRGNDLVTVGVDSRGRIWTGSASRGFTYYDPVTRIWDRDSEEWPDPRIRVIRCLQEGVYIGTQGGLSLKPTENRTDICADSDPGCIVPSYVVNDYALLGDTLWVATDRGLGRFNGDTWDSAGALPAGSIGQRSLSLAVFGGTLWEVTGDRRVRRLADGAWTSVTLTANRLAVAGGRLYAFGIGNAVYRWEGAAWLQLPSPVPDFQTIRDIAGTGQDLWLALDVGLAQWRGGPSVVNRFYPPGPRFRGSYSGLAIDRQGIVWAGTSDQSVGLARFDGEVWTGIRALEEGLSEGWILGMFSGRDDVIWVGHCCCSVPTECPLQHVDPDSIRTVREVYNIWSFDDDEGRRIWLGSRGRGVLVRDQDTDQPLFDLTPTGTNGALSSSNITALAVTATETFIGTEASGLDVWPHGGDLTRGRDGTGWIHIGQSSLGLLDDSIEWLEFREGQLWVATAGGIHSLRGTQVEDRCPARNRSLPGDPARKVNAIAADRLGGLWVATDNGLLYHPRGGVCDAAGGDFFIFTMDNSPLPSNRVLTAALNPADGAMWFGTVEGLLRVDPLAFTGSPPPPDRFVLYPNPILPDGEAARRRVIFGISRSGNLAEPVPAAISTQPKVYDLAGRHVGDFQRGAGTGEGSWVWFGTNQNGDTVAPGIYLVRSEVEGEIVTLKLGVIR